MNIKVCIVLCISVQRLKFISTFVQKGTIRNEIYAKGFQVTTGSFFNGLYLAYEGFYSCKRVYLSNGTFLHELILNEDCCTPVNLFTWYLYVCIAYTVSKTHC